MMWPLPCSRKNGSAACVTTCPSTGGTCTAGNPSGDTCNDLPPPSVSYTCTCANGAYTGDDVVELQLLPPRFTSPSRVWLRFADAAGGISSDGTLVQADTTISPVCGYLVPNHLDGDLEFFDDAGQNLGNVRPDPVAGIVWEDAPGVPSTVGQTPERAIPNQFCGSSPAKHESSVNHNYHWGRKDW